MEFDVFGLENVDVAFEKITPLKYSQPMALGGECFVMRWKVRV